MEMIFSVFPVANKYIKEASNEIGMAKTMMKVARQRPRKMNTTSITKIKVMKMVLRKLPMELMMLVEPSTMICTLTSLGSVGSIWASCFLMPLMTLTALASVCFWMTMVAPCTPLL